MEYGILKFTSKYRVQGTGVPFRSFTINTVINVKKTNRNVDAWAKVNTDTQQLVEILGPVGDVDVERRVYLYQYRIIPCHYPTVRYEEPVIDRSFDHIAITIDGPMTEDMDDAISLSMSPGGNWLLGVHITDTTHLPAELFEWSRSRGASAYPCGKPAVHMLPDKACSLVRGATYPCISLLIEIHKETHAILSIVDRCTHVHVEENATYEAFGREDQYKDIRYVLGVLSGADKPEDQVAWTMVFYNTHLARVLLDRGILFRCRPTHDAIAEYSLTDCGHYDMGFAPYTHMTSPMRRFPDMFNQHVYKGVPVDSGDMAILNERMAQIQRFHYQDTVAYLAHACMTAPLIISTITRVSEDGNRVTVDYDGKRLHIPLWDVFFAEPLADTLKEPGQHQVELHGVLKDGRAQLRVRLCDHHTIQPSIVKHPGENNKRHMTDAPFSIERDPVEAAERMRELLGYPLDDFQMRALDVVLSGDDLLGMAPTGSGKTVLAMLGVVLRAFDVGKRAIFTSPIKALSNQKFSEFNEWLRKVFGEDQCRVTLLTGDIQSRATLPGGDGKPELLIMTNEILSNKLEVGEDDPDLANVSVVIMDEVHYINDPDRGASWEKGLMLMPKHIQIIALSATLTHPEQFCEWLSRRNPTRIVQRFDRHVPLHFGLYTKGDFKPLYSTNDDTHTINTADYDYCIKHKTPMPKAMDIVNMLDKDDKLPAIVFMMSRDKCMQSAHSITRNLLINPRPVKAKDQCEYDYAWQLEQHQEVAQHVRKHQDQMYKHYLGPHKAHIEAVPGFYEFKELLDNGVGYHHAGMLPILREYVELLFKNKFLRVVFATETLGVGLNMPARTVVFTQLDKPGDGTMRPLRPDEFWQMAGRAGRRGMDTQGYVVYYPMRDNSVIRATELHAILCGQIPSAKSQLKLDPVTVLRQIRRAESDLDKTLMQHQNIKAIRVLQEQLDKFPVMDEDTIRDMTASLELKKRMDQKVDFIKLTPKQYKDAQTKQKKLIDKYGTAFDKLVEKVSDRQALEREIEALKTNVSRQVKDITRWLADMGMVDGSALTTKGLVCSDMVEGSPIVRGSIVYDGYLEHADVDDIITWLAGFTEAMRFLPNAEQRLPTSLFPDALGNEVYEVDEYHWTTAALMRVWLNSRDIRVIAGYIGMHNLGVFVRIVLRTKNFVDETHKALLGLQMYETCNLLEGYREKLLYGVVSIMSLYVN